MILYITLSSFYYLAHESGTLALDYIDNSLLRAERGHLSSSLICHSPEVFPLSKL